MKEDIRKAYRKFYWNFADYISFIPQLGGSSKRKQKRLFTKVTTEGTIRFNKLFITKAMEE